ncbi:MAG: hypothetical protein VKN60_11910 [Cyanobacteriota bacterium]|nr:hypothetical protein [Cyanobacteriota bacterium]
MSALADPSPDLNRRWQESIHRERRSRNLAFDYALGLTLIPLLPFQGYYTPRLILVLLLLAKMLWDIGRIWDFTTGQDPLAIAGNLLGAFGALATGFLVWLIFLGLGLWLPGVGSFKGAAGLFTLTWMLGQATNQFYANGYRKVRENKARATR